MHYVLHQKPIKLNTELLSEMHYNFSSEYLNVLDSMFFFGLNTFFGTLFVKA